MAILRPMVLALTIVLTSPGAAAATAHPATPVWPLQGQAAYAISGGPVHRSPGVHMAPIASMAKLMTAYLVVRRHPLALGAAGFTMVVTSADVADRARRVARWESTVPVRAGERLTERQALTALLLPSANNVAIMLARRLSGSVPRFVALMNATARSLGMTHTVYTDPSGFTATTRSTPGDQVRLARAAHGRLTIRRMVALRSSWVPVAGWVHNTNTLLGSGGFYGTKTGSMSQSGGCLVFRTRRVVDGRAVDVFGVVMGQYGPDLIGAAVAAARGMAHRIAPRVAG